MQRRFELMFTPLSSGGRKLVIQFPDGWCEHRISVEVSFLCSAVPAGPGNLNLNVIRWPTDPSGFKHFSSDPAEIAMLVSTAKAASDFALGLRSTGRYETAGFDALEIVNGLGVQLVAVHLLARVLPTPVEQP